MSDLMLYGVLRMPYDMAMSDEMSRRQFYGRVQEAVRRMEVAEAKLEELSRATPPSPSTASEADERAAFEAWWRKRVPVGEDSAHAIAFGFEVWRAALAAKPSAREAAPIAYLTADGRYLIFANHVSAESAPYMTPLVAGRADGEVPEGYVLVPDVPTEAMIVAIERKVDEQLVASGMWAADMQRQDGADIYAAAIAAAPAPTNTGTEEGNGN